MNDWMFEFWNVSMYGISECCNVLMFVWNVWTFGMYKRSNVLMFGFLNDWLVRILEAFKYSSEWNVRLFYFWGQQILK